MALIIATAVQKGGNGKTTFAAHLAYAARDEGKRVLVVDFDTQGHVSMILTGDPDINKAEEGGAQSLFEKGKQPWRELLSGISLLHGHSQLVRIDQEDGGDLLEKAIDMRESIRSLPFDIIIFDTPPQGIRQLVTMMWAHRILIPIEPVSLSVEGLTTIEELIESAQSVNPDLDYGIVINRFQFSSAQQRRTVEDLQDVYQDRILEVFRSKVHVSDALSNGIPVWEYSKDRKLGKGWKDFCLSALGV